MRIGCVGGGPGGLFFATLLKRRRPEVEVVVFERNRPDDTFGFGVVFSDATLGAIDDADPVLREAFRTRGRHWDEIEVRVGGGVQRCGGMGMASVARKTLLRLLQERAAAAGVEMRFEHEVTDPAELDGFDLVVVSDGANSRFRDRFAADFAPEHETATAKFIWFGTPYRFGGLTFVHEDGPHGPFALHAYPIDAETSTFIVETDPESWQAAGLDEFDVTRPPGVSDEKTRRYLEDLFAHQIDGHRLLTNNSRWGNFVTRRARRWRSGRWVLLGDAAHTAHFSVGSGTKMAMEDAVCLAAALDAHGDDIEAAFEAYEQQRRPDVERIQRLGRPSLSWWEHFGRYVRSFDDPAQFTFHFLTRSITREKLARRDAAFVDRVDRAWLDRHGHPPLATPIEVGGVRLSSRLLTMDPDGTVDGPAVAWLDAPEQEADLPAAMNRLRSLVAQDARLIAVRGGSPLTRVLLAEESRLGLGAAVLLAGDYDDDLARTMVQSGRADLVGVLR